MVKYSFVMLCYNNWSMTKEAITSLVRSLHPFQENGIEIIIVDNGSIDETPTGINQLKQEFGNKLLKIENIRLEPNMGYTPGINAGLSKCQGDIITILNNDMVFPKNWFKGLVEVLESDEKIGLVAPYLSRSSGLQNVKKTFYSTEELEIFAEMFMKQHENKIIFTHRVIGACMVFKREVIEKIGGNDIWFGLGQFDDDDWCVRTIIAGYKIVVVGKSFVHHISTVTYKQQSPVMKESYRVNKRKFRKKWGIKRKNQLQGVLENMDFEKEKHYCPTKLEEFNRVESQPLKTDKINRKFLLVADWSNSFSKWQETLLNSIQHLQEAEEIHLWVPPIYYKGFNPLSKISPDLPSSSLSNIKIITENISPLDLVIFLESFDGIFSVDNDYINKYMVYIANNISLPTY